MEDLADPRGVVAMILEVLGPHRPVSDTGSGIAVAERTGGVGVIPGHEGGTRGTTVGALAVGSCKESSPGGEAVDVGGLTDFVAVAGECCVSEIV